MGALGTHVAEGLVRAGIAKLIIVDRDYIEK
jgi:molybdopterin/thiamine biosynthesis adenylyltransferase